MYAPDFEDIVRTTLPLFKDYGGYKKLRTSPFNIKDFDRGRISRLSTRREVYEDYKYWTEVSERAFFKCFVFGITAVFLGLVALRTGNFVLGSIAAISFGLSPFFYREAFGLFPRKD